MFRFVGLLVGSLFATALPPAQAAADAALVKRFITTYCLECHGPEKQKGDRRFDALLLPAAKVDTLIDLKDMMDQLHLGDMPPAKAKQPATEEQSVFLEQVALALAEGREALASTGGSTVLRRLNRREYLNTIGDLFGLNMAAFDPTTTFPRDQAEEHRTTSATYSGPRAICSTSISKRPTSSSRRRSRFKSDRRNACGTSATTSSPSRS